MVICTGSQGEPYSALSLMAGRSHKFVKITEGDTVVLSSSLIPGNEPAIHRVVDSLYRTGADVFHMPADPVHASGHAGQEELRLMLSLVRPRWFIPSTASAGTCSTTHGWRWRSGSRATT